MSRLSMNEITTYRWTFQEDVLNYAAANIPAIGVWRAKLADFGEERGAELLCESGLHVSHIQWAGGFTGHDGRTFSESVHDGLEAVRLAAHLKADCLVVYSGGRAGHTVNHARRLFREALCALCVLGEELGVSIAIEPMHPGCAREWTFLTSLDDALQTIHECNHANLKLVFDTYHLCHTPSIMDRIPEIAPHVALVQLGDGKAPPTKDQDRTPLGRGCLPLREVCQALLRAGYDGYFDVELIGEEIEAMNYAELIKHSRDEFQKLVA